jgi:hypothetical protein
MRAVESYRRALELDPRNQSVRSAVQRLEARPKLSSLIDAADRLPDVRLLMAKALPS